MPIATPINRTSQPTGLGAVPPASEGPRTFGVMFDFTTGSVLPLNVSFADVGMSIVQALFIDNRNNSASATFQIGGSNQFLVCPPYTQGFFPALIVGNSNLFIVGNSAGNVQVPVQLLNTDVPPALWYATNPTVSGTVTVNGTVSTQPLVGTYTDRSGSIAIANTSQQVAVANGARKRFFIQNPYTAAGQNIGAAESLFINFTTAAGVNTGASIELLAGASFDTGQGPITTEVINVIATTAGHRFIAKEM